MDPLTGMKKAHVLMVTSEYRVHLDIFMQILHRLSQKGPGIIVTVLSSKEQLLRLDRSRASFAGLDLRLKNVFGKGTAELRRADPTLHIDISIEVEMNRLESESLRKKLVAQKDAPGAPTCIVSSKFQYWSADWASELGIPWYTMLPSPVYALTVLEFLKVHEAGVAIDSPSVVADVPGVVPAPIMSLFRIEDLAQNIMLKPQFMINVANSMKRAAAVVINSSENLEPRGETVKGLRSVLHPSKVFTIGPILQFPGFGFSLSEYENCNCLQWLDSQREKSVLYVAFGTSFRASDSRVLDIAAGIEASGVPFLWVLRLDGRQLFEVLPSGFVSRTHKLGRIETSHVPQTKILSHQSIGGFLNHAGWNSLMEAVCAGVPVLGWPLGGDHYVHVRYMMDLAEVGYSITNFKADNKQSFGDIGSGVIETAVRYMMRENKGENLVQRNLKAMQKAVQADMTEGGTSNRNFQVFLDLIANP